MKRLDLFDRFHLFQGHIRTEDTPSACPQAESAEPFVPSLLEHIQTELRYHSFSAERWGADLLLDAYELRNTGSRDLYYPVLPSPCMGLYFKLGGDTVQAVFSGMTTTLSALVLPPDHTVFCVRFQPGVADFFTKTPAKKLTNHTFPLNVFLPGTAELLRNVQQSRFFSERVQAIRTYFFAHPYIPEDGEHGLLSRSMEMIHRRHGILRVSEVAEELSCSERYLCRLFNNWVGVPTKQYCELIQLQFSLGEILSRRPKTLAKTAATFGYFDQPHMNRVYQKFLGRTASDMLFFDDASCNTAGMSVII